MPDNLCHFSHPVLEALAAQLLTTEEREMLLCSPRNLRAMFPRGDSGAAYEQMAREQVADTERQISRAKLIFLLIDTARALGIDPYADGVIVYPKE